MKSFDFNAVQQPTWPVSLGAGDTRTTVNLIYPTVDLFDRFTAMTPELQDAAKTKDVKSVRAVYGVLAEILSCNDDGFTFTAEELRDKYKLTLLGATKFVAGYMDFLREAQEEKN